MPPDQVDRVIGARIRATRRRKDVTQQQLAAAIGVSYQQVQKYETGLDRISASALSRAAAALGEPIGNFFPQPEARQHAV